MTTAGSRGRVGGAGLASLRRIVTTEPRRPDGERCEMCAEPIPARHRHVVDLESRNLMCACTGCSLLFTRSTAVTRYRTVPDRYLSLDDCAVGAAVWDELQIPVNLAFFFTDSRTGRTTAFYPGPAGATESELSTGAWASLVDRNSRLATPLPDVEAVMMRVHADGTPSECYLVPIDSAYELVGRLRRVWRGFDGGSDAKAELAQYFDDLRARSRPASTRPAAGGTR
ncbi:DUF5947 family protein [Tsukamurella soli]|uniref:DUF5947 family protein n=1 Tax=Tsukamurella soli TaxID=644556 RepID=A0ABP8JFC0_9ACTN